MVMTEVEWLYAEFGELRAERDALLDALRQIAEWPDGGNRYGQANIQRFAQNVIDAHPKQEGTMTTNKPEVVARLLTWAGPRHGPVPWEGVCARTFAGFPLENSFHGHWKEGEPLIRLSDYEALQAEYERLAGALALLPDEFLMVEHNPYEGPLMFCCGQRVTSSGLHDLRINHSKECWYARMRAMRDSDQEDRND